MSVSMGLDVDSKTSYIFAFDTQHGELLYDGRITHSRSDWEKLLTRFPGCRIFACYEAGGIGYNLSRMLNDLGVDCKIAAPSMVPRSANDKQQIKAFLEFYQLKAGSNVKNLWTKTGMQWLKTVECKDSVRISLNAHIATVEHHDAILRSLEKAIKELSRTVKYKTDCDRLTSQLSGVGTLLAMSFLTELFRPWEFDNAKALSCHVGLTPCEWSSGGRIRQGHITRWGIPHLRKHLVEAAWVWIRMDLQARKRYQEIRSGKEPKKAIVAMARRLAIVMWAMTVKKEDYNYQWAA